jgi:hypothetical protein
MVFKNLKELDVVLKEIVCEKFEGEIGGEGDKTDCKC